MATAISDSETPINKLGKLLPSEVTGLYVSMRVFFLDTSIQGYGYYIIGTAAVALIIGILFIRFVRGVTNPVHLAIYGITFAVWALTLDVDHVRQFFASSVPLQSIVGVTSLLVSFVFPFLITSRSVASAP